MIQFLILLAAGILGILTNNLMEIDKINQSTDGNCNLKQYGKKNWAAIATAFCVVLVTSICPQYIDSLKAAGLGLVLGEFAIGMVGPYVAEFIRGRAKNNLPK